MRCGSGDAPLKPHCGVPTLAQQDRPAPGGCSGSAAVRVRGKERPCQRWRPTPRDERCLLMLRGTGMQVTRQRRRVSKVRLGVFGGTRLRIVAVATTAVVLVGAGITYASTEGFGQNQVGTEYANGIQ